MANTYISFLGTNNYIECFYTLNNESVTQQSVRFVQQATIQEYCSSWDESDQILILNTQEAQQKNWLDDGHNEACDGLNTCLKKLKLKAKISSITIPSGHSEAEIWEIFNILQENIRENDQLVLDITHAFRSIPLLALVVINYAKTLKNIQVTNISYGAMEAVGNFQEVNSLPVEERQIPLFDLTVFYSLLEWTQAIDSFEHSGNSSRILKLAHSSLIPKIKDNSDEKAEAILLKDMAVRLSNLSEDISSCRALSIKEDAKKLKQSIDKVQQSKIIPPLVPLFDKIDDFSDRLINDECNSGIEAAKWCIEHNLIQQAYTIFQETLISWALISIGLDQDQTQNKINRGLVNSIVSMIVHKIEKDKWDAYLQDNIEISIKLYEKLNAAHKNCIMLGQLTDLRNDINHAGYRSTPLEAKKLKSKIKKMVDNFSNSKTNSQAC